MFLGEIMNRLIVFSFSQRQWRACPFLNWSQVWDESYVTISNPILCTQNIFIQWNSLDCCSQLLPSPGEVALDGVG